MPVSRRFSSSDRLVSKWNGQVTSSLAVVRKNSEMVSVAMREATSPARCPPMPSATTKRSYSLSTTKESSLCSRWSPTSLSPAATARIKATKPPTGKDFHPPTRVSSRSGHHVGRSKVLKLVTQVQAGAWARRDRGAACRDRGVACLDRGVACRDRGVACRDRGVACLDRGVACRDCGAVCPDCAASDLQDVLLLRRDEHVHPLDRLLHGLLHLLFGPVHVV